MSKNRQFKHQVISDFLHGKVSRRPASELLQITERTVSRMAGRIKLKGLFGVIHGNRGRAPVNKTPQEIKKSVMKLVEEKYFDFNMSHCLEVLGSEEHLEVKYSTLRRWCHQKHLVKRTKRRKGVVRQRRDRMPSGR